MICLGVIEIICNQLFAYNVFCCDGVSRTGNGSCISKRDIGDVRKDVEAEVSIPTGH